MHILIAPWLKNVYISSQKSSRKSQNSWREKDIIQPTLWKRKSLVFLFPCLTLCVPTAGGRRQIKHTHTQNHYSVSLHGRKVAMPLNLKEFTAASHDYCLEGSNEGPHGWVESGALLAQVFLQNHSPGSGVAGWGPGRLPAHLLPTPTQRWERDNTQWGSRSTLWRASLHIYCDPAQLAHSNYWEATLMYFKHVPNADR